MCECGRSCTGHDGRRFAARVGGKARVLLRYRNVLDAQNPAPEISFSIDGWVRHSKASRPQRHDATRLRWQHERGGFSRRDDLIFGDSTAASFRHRGRGGCARRGVRAGLGVIAGWCGGNEGRKRCMLVLRPTVPPWRRDGRGGGEGSWGRRIRTGVPRLRLIRVDEDRRRVRGACGAIRRHFGNRLRHAAQLPAHRDQHQAREQVQAGRLGDGRAQILDELEEEEDGIGRGVGHGGIRPHKSSLTPNGPKEILVLPIAGGVGGNPRIEIRV